MQKCLEIIDKAEIEEFFGYSCENCEFEILIFWYLHQKQFFSSFSKFWEKYCEDCCVDQNIELNCVKNYMRVVTKLTLGHQFFFKILSHFVQRKIQ